MTTHKSMGWSEFLTLCHDARSKELLDALFGFLFTHEEKEQLALRVELVKELLKGEKTQREIARHLNISIAKITRGSNALKTISQELRAFIQRHLTVAKSI